MGFSWAMLVSGRVIEKEHHHLPNKPPFWASTCEFSRVCQEKKPATNETTRIPYTYQPVPGF